MVKVRDIISKTTDDLVKNKVIPHNNKIKTPELLQQVKTSHSLESYNNKVDNNDKGKLVPLGSKDNKLNGADAVAVNIKDGTVISIQYKYRFNQEVKAEDLYEMSLRYKDNAHFIEIYIPRNKSSEQHIEYKKFYDMVNKQKIKGCVLVIKYDDYSLDSNLDMYDEKKLEDAIVHYMTKINKDKLFNEYVENKVKSQFFSLNDKINPTILEKKLNQDNIENLTDEGKNTLKFLESKNLVVHEADHLKTDEVGSNYLRVDDDYLDKIKTTKE